MVWFSHFHCGGGNSHVARRPPRLNEYSQAATTLCIVFPADALAARHVFFPPSSLCSNSLSHVLCYFATFSHHQGQCWYFVHCQVVRSKTWLWAEIMRACLAASIDIHRQSVFSLKDGVERPRLSFMHGDTTVAYVIKKPPQSLQNDESTWSLEKLAWKYHWIKTNSGAEVFHTYLVFYP